MRLVLRRQVVLVLAVALAAAPAWLVRAGATAAVVGTVATDDSYPATEDADLAVASVDGLLANDNPGPDTCVFEIDDTGLDGSVDVLADGSFTYSPAANFNGETSFTYSVQVAGGVECAGPPDGSATVTITVAPVNDAPTATADSFIVLKDTTLNVGVPGVLINDDDIDGDSLTAQKVTSPSHGVLVLAADGSFSYTPTTGYTGPDAFSYRAKDPDLATSPTRVVSLTIKAVPPVPTPTPVPTPEPTPTLEATAEPTPSPSVDPSPSIEPSAMPSESVAPSPSVSATPAASPSPVPASDGGGVSLPVLLVIVLFVLLLGFGAALYVPKWLEAQRGGPRDLD